MSFMKAKFQAVADHLENAKSDLENGLSSIVDLEDSLYPLKDFETEETQDLGVDIDYDKIKKMIWELEDLLNKNLDDVQSVLNSLYPPEPDHRGE